MSSIDHIHSETKMLQVEDHLNLLSAQYLVQCLDTDNACHHITKMDLPPREMKDTIFTRHYQTVLPLLANNRKDTLQALHTSYVSTAIGNMKDNRVLNNGPISINDEATLLARRQRTTLSQLRSGHCKLLIFYKKRLKQCDSSSCPDCGMDPRDVPCCFCCLPTPMTLASGGGSPMFPLVFHQPASPSIWPAVQSLRRGLSINPGVTMWCVCGCS